MKIRVTDTFEMPDVVADAIIENNKLEVDGNKRREAIRDFFTAQVQGVIDTNSVGLEDKIAEYDKKRGQALANTFKKLAKKRGISIAELASQIAAMEDSSEDEEEVDTEEESEDNESGDEY